jgi:hypothetical protein
MPDPEQVQQPEKPEAAKEQGCPVIMYGGRRCGRPIYKASPGADETPVCLMHSRDPNKDDAAFQAEVEGILQEAGEGVADFTRFVFPSTSYSRRKFAARCFFEWATFTQVALFNGARFTQEANFFMAAFKRDASFLGAGFTGTAYFSGAKFTHGALFFGATFEQAATFNQATFERGAQFSNATFTGEAFFIETSFEGYAHLSRATFTQDAYFTGATFIQDAAFDYATFMQSPNFTEATFTREADFSGATFTKVADLSKAKFLGSAEFRETRFRRDTSRDPGPIFARAHFEKPEAVEFADVYLGQALFFRCDVSKVAFSNVRWGRRENGKWMLFEEVVSLYHLGAHFELRPEEGMPDERNYMVIAELYQQLKKNYDDRRDYWTAGDFHYGEMEMKRLACPRPTWLAWLEAKLLGKPSLRKLGERCAKLQSNAWLLSKLRWCHQLFGLAAWYRRASDYGESWGKPLLWLFAVLALSAALYPLLGLRPAAGKSPVAKTTSVQVATPSPQETDLRYWNYERPGRLFCHSVMTSLGVAAFQRDLAYEPSYPWGRLLALFELLLTSTLIALFLLAVRRQFRR